MSGAEIQADIAAALIEAGEAVGTGAYTCTIRRASSEPDEPQNPWDEPADPVNAPVDYEVTAVQSTTRNTYQNGTLIGELRRVLTINATGVYPLKSDKVAIGVAPADVTESTVFQEILEIETEEPGGIALLHDIHVAV